MTPTQRYADMVHARERQKAELATPLTEQRWAKYAPSYRFDPRREPEPLLAATLELVEPDDEIIEVGGGAGRIGLPLALRARSLINVEPSAGMREQFEICVAEHDIANAGVRAELWPPAEPLEADLVVSADVTYFIAEIEPFLLAMDRAARRRAALLTWTVPPPNVNAALFRRAFGVEEAPAPSFRELLPVLWEAGIAPDVRVLDEWFSWPEQLPTDEQSAIGFALGELEPRDVERARERIAAALGDLYERGGEVWRPRWRTPSQAMLISWRTEGRGG